MFVVLMDRKMYGKEGVEESAALSVVLPVSSVPKPGLFIKRVFKGEL
jgi:hypothetical protein